MTSKRSVRRQYSKDFKQEAIELLLSSGKTATEIAKNLGIRAELLYRWKREYLNGKDRAFPGSGHLNEDAEEERLRKLEWENRELKEERDILKKALAIFSKKTQ